MSGGSSKRREVLEDLSTLPPGTAINIDEICPERYRLLKENPKENLFDYASFILEEVKRLAEGCYVNLPEDTHEMVVRAVYIGLEKRQKSIILDPKLKERIDTEDILEGLKTEPLSFNFPGAPLNPLFPEQEPKASSIEFSGPLAEVTIFPQLDLMASIVARSHGMKFQAVPTQKEYVMEGEAEGEAKPKSKPNPKKRGRTTDATVFSASGGASAGSALAKIIVLDSKDETTLGNHIDLILRVNTGKKEPKKQYQQAQQYIFDTLNTFLDKETKSSLKTMNLSWDLYESSSTEQERVGALNQWIRAAEKVKAKISASDFTENTRIRLIIWIESDIQVTKELLKGEVSSFSPDA
jgi:hypothetical protein